MNGQRILWLLVPVLAASALWMARKGPITASVVSEPTKATAAPPPDAAESGQPPADSQTAFPVPGNTVAAEPEQKNPWPDLLINAKNLNPESEEDLDRLYSKARAAIEADQRNSLESFRQLAPQLGELSMPESFFAVSSLMRYGDSPDQVLNSLLESRPREQPVNPRAHHEATTPAENYDHVAAFAVRELRTRLESDPRVFNEQMRANLVSQMTDRARGERSLDISIEMIQTLKMLNAPQAVEAALSGHSPRDQELIRGILE